MVGFATTVISEIPQIEYRVIIYSGILCSGAQVFICLFRNTEQIIDVRVVKSTGTLLPSRY